MAHSDPITQALGMSDSQARASRTFDLVVIPIIVVVLSAAFHLHYMLTAGDWDFWVDWKDRLYWPIISSLSFILFASVVQGLLWRILRLPIGMTLVALGLVLMEWASRYFSFHLWAYFPMSQVWPATWLAVGLFMDSMLLLSRSWLVTAIIGCFFLPAVFVMSNYPMLAPFLVPAELMNNQVTVADLVGFVFQRGGSPEYLRIIEQPGLRILGGQTWFIASLFGGFAGIFVYMLGWWFGVIAAKPWTAANPLEEFIVEPKPEDQVQELTVESYPLAENTRGASTGY